MGFVLIIALTISRNSLKVFDVWIYTDKVSKPLAFPGKIVC